MTTAAEFRAWRKALDLNQSEAARRLGVSRLAVIRYERGRRYDGGPAPIPRSIALAMSAIAAGLDEYRSGRRINRKGA